MNTEKLTAKEILAIAKNRPEMLFEGKDLAHEYKILALKWHPDKNKDKDAEEVFKHIGELHKEAESKLKAGTWNQFGLLKLNDLNGTKYEIKYLKEVPFELGVSYIGTAAITYLLEPGYQDLIRATKDILENHLHYKNDDMKKEFSRYLPKIKKSFSTSTHNVVYIGKATNEIALRDVLAYYKGELDPKHTAWIVSSMYNLLCYLQYTEVVHNGLDMGTYFIDPATHNGSILGGWWYSKQVGHTIDAIPDRTVVADLDLLKTKVSRHYTDLELLKSIARELIGGKDQISLVRKSSAPQALIDWACQPTVGNAFEEYSKWRTVLKESFGPRKFTPMNLTADEVYKEK